MTERERLRRLMLPAAEAERMSLGVLQDAITEYFNDSHWVNGTWVNSTAVVPAPSPISSIATEPELLKQIDRQVERNLANATAKAPLSSHRIREMSDLLEPEGYLIVTQIGHNQGLEAIDKLKALEKSADALICRSRERIAAAEGEVSTLRAENEALQRRVNTLEADNAGLLAWVDSLAKARKPLEDEIDQIREWVKRQTFKANQVSESRTHSHDTPGDVALTAGAFPALQMPVKPPLFLSAPRVMERIEVAALAEAKA